MIASRRRRASDSKLVAGVSLVTYDGLGPDTCLPDGLWDIVIQRHAGTVTVLQAGLNTRPIELAYEAGDEHLSISFKPGVVMPRLPGERMVDRTVVRPTVSKRAFALDGDILEIPTFENAEGLVEALVRKGIVVCDDFVGDEAEDRPTAASLRTVQRHFQWALGVTPKHLQQMQRACQAVAMLQQGRPAVQVAADLDYADQPHMTRSLRRFTGRTPVEIANSRLGI